jgi:modification methylase
MPKKKNPSIIVHLGDYQDTLAHVSADLIFCSPPYNIGSRQPASTGRRKHGLYDPKSYRAIRDYPDSLPEHEYQDSQEQFLLWAADHLTLNGTLVYNHKPRRNGRMIHPAEWFCRSTVRARLCLMEEVIWNRGSTHNHCKKMFYPTTERLYVFRRADSGYRLTNTQGLSDIWTILPARRNGHNAPFPSTLAERVIETFSAKGDVICDPYTGSGTTALAAMKLGRRFEGSEILEKYHCMALELLSC